MGEGVTERVSAKGGARPRRQDLDGDRFDAGGCQQGNAPGRLPSSAKRERGSFDFSTDLTRVAPEAERP